MRHYQHQTEALRATLLMVTRGYKYGVVFNTLAEKAQAISNKWDEQYGVNLPAWKRYSRRKSGLPNAWACSMPAAGQHSQRIFILLTDANPDQIKKLPSASPWRRENWRPVDALSFGYYKLATEKNAAGVITVTYRLTPAALSGLDGYWRSLANSDPEALVRDIAHAVSFYAMFGGVRRQLRRLIKGYKRLYQLRTKRDWPGPDPDALPSMGAFTASATVV